MVRVIQRTSVERSQLEDLTTRWHLSNVLPVYSLNSQHQHQYYQRKQEQTVTEESIMESTMDSSVSLKSVGTQVASQTAAAPPVQGYRSEIETCIKLGLIDEKALAERGGLPPVSSCSAAASVGSSAPPVPSKNTNRFVDLPHRKMWTRRELDAKWRALHNDVIKLDQSALKQLITFQRQWEDLDRKFNAIGKQSRMWFRDSMNQEWEKFQELCDSQIETEKKLNDDIEERRREIERRWTEIRGRSVDKKHRCDMGSGSKREKEETPMEVTC